MNAPLARLAATLVRVWTRVYTWGMDPVDRDSRRDEIESDLWESLHDEASSEAAIAGRIVLRLLGGVADDLRWRVEEPSLDARARVTLAIAGVGVLVAGILLFVIARPGTLPPVPPPPAPTARGVGLIPPPPPPPPPPPAPYR